VSLQLSKPRHPYVKSSRSKRALDALYYANEPGTKTTMRDGETYITALTGVRRRLGVGAMNQKARPIIKKALKDEKRLKRSGVAPVAFTLPEGVKAPE
jgi:hypothetical protein